MKRRTVNISKEAYEVVSKYCKERALKINALVELVLKNELKDKMNDTTK